MICTLTNQIKFDLLLFVEKMFVQHGPKFPQLSFCTILNNSRYPNEDASRFKHINFILFVNREERVAEDSLTSGIFPTFI